MLGKNFSCFFVESKGVFFFRSQRGIFMLRLGSFFFFKETKEGVVFVFPTKEIFKRFISGLFNNFKVFFYYFKLKVRGLGYRIKRITQRLFRFFMGTTNFFFFHVPKDILVRARRRRMLLISYNKASLNLVFSHLLLLKRLVPYQLRGVFFPKQVILLKPGKKRF